MKTIWTKKNIIINIAAVLAVAVLYAAILFGLAKLGVVLPNWFTFTTGFVIGILSVYTSSKYRPYRFDR